MRENELVLKPINALLGYDFFIPSYQRGYRWTEKQVNELLEDIWSFATNPPRQEEGKIRPFYCLQPIVVKPRRNDEGTWEVIDGQQRLTTIFLILKNLESLIEKDQKNFNSISYETRKESEEFLKDIDLEKASSNIDFHHIVQADKAIHQWFRDKANSTEYATPRAKFAPVFLTDTKIIWYAVYDGSDSYEIFTRLNIGKIQLTNAELIRALFLKNWNNAEAVDRLRLKQLQIATEWDWIENTLQDDSFWYFIYNRVDADKPKYINRIEYIFDLMTKKPEDADSKFTFYVFYQEFETSKAKNPLGIPDTDALWLEVKKYFLTFEEWYKDRELYHLIGFLISINFKIEDILEPKGIRGNKISSKTEFKTFLKDEIRKTMDFDIRELYYGDKRIRTVLLLFNIQTILSNEQSNLRFPFDLYKNEKWDIEHIRSQTDKNITIKSQKIRWALDILEYFTGLSDEEGTREYIERLKDEEGLSSHTLSIVGQDSQILTDLYLVAYDKEIDISFEEIFDKIRRILKEDNEPRTHAISNLALLNASINRSYQNAFFSIKRQVLLKKDMSGGFIPICTKNVFMKAYSKKIDGMMYWSEDDADAYLKAIEEILKDYLPQQNREHTEYGQG